MATQTIVVLPVANYTTQTITSPSMDVPANLLAMTLRMVSTAYTSPAFTCDVQVDESYDNGVTWGNVVGFTSSGGLDKAGNPRQPSLRLDFSKEQRAAAIVRARLVAVGAWRYGFAMDLLT